MNREDKKLQKHLLDEMIKVSETNPDVMYYMEALMKSYEELEQENINIKQQLLKNKISLKDVEYQKKKYKNIIDELEKDLQSKIDEDRLNLISNPHWLYVLDKLKELKDNNK